MTHIGKYKLLSIMDLGTRQVIAHKLFSVSPKWQDVAQLISIAASLRQRPKMFHSDSDGLFNCPKLDAELKTDHIVISRGNQNIKKHHNQVQERFHRTLKDFIADHIGLPKRKKGKKHYWQRSCNFGTCRCPGHYYPHY